jgi:hypothetical protein
MVIGTIDFLVETLRRRREQYGISYVHVHFKIWRGSRQWLRA